MRKVTARGRLKLLPHAEFVFVTCQAKAEHALKDEMSQLWPEFRFSYSQPGFLTYKLPAWLNLAEDFALNTVLGREYGLSLGAVEGESRQAKMDVLEERLAGETFNHLAVFPRLRFLPGSKDDEAAIKAEALAVEAELKGRLSAKNILQNPSNEPLGRWGDRVLDVVLLDEQHWWAGYHRHGPDHLPWPGGLCPFTLPPHAVSRAYLKAAEALTWANFPLHEGQWCAELGSSPGGASQALLERGLNVMGIDPAEMADAVLQHPQFVHIRKRSHEVRRREFRKVRWLLADMNVAPTYTLDAIEAIVQHPENRIRGLLLTLKLLDWKFLTDLPQYLSRVRRWGFPHLHTRQLSHHRQEFALCAIRPHE